MVSESEVIITDQFEDSGSANQHTVRHKVIVPVAAARHLLKKKSACQKLPRTIMPVVGLAAILLVAILFCIIYETWLTSVRNSVRRIYGNNFSFRRTWSSASNLILKVCVLEEHCRALRIR